MFDRFETDAKCLAFNGRVRCEEPTEHFGRFTAFIYPDASSDESFPLNADNTLLRGCVLRNVEFVYGLVVYTGDQTKVWRPSFGLCLSLISWRERVLLRTQTFPFVGLTKSSSDTSLLHASHCFCPSMPHCSALVCRALS